MNVQRHDELQTALSIASFEATDTATFRQNLRAQLSQILQHCQVQGDDHDVAISHYNPHQLTSALLQALDWKEHCKYHDERAVKCEVMASDLETSPLNELVKTLLDPRVIPLALSSSILRVLVQAFLTFNPTVKRETKRPSRKPDKKSKGTAPKSPGSAAPYVCSRWTPSQLLLLESIKQVMVARQCREKLETIIISAYKTTTVNHIHHNQGQPSLDASQNLLSLTKYCARSLEGVGPKGCYYYPLSTLFPCLINLYQTIMDPKKQLVDVSSERILCCSSCGKYSDLQLQSSTRKRKRSRMDMVAYHDEEHKVLGDNQNIWQSLSHQREKPSHSMVSLKSIMEAADTTDVACPYCQSTIAPREPSSLDGQNTKAWCQLRDKCIHSMISFFQSTKQVSKHRAFQLFRDIVLTAFVDDPTIRLLVLQMAHAAGRDGYGYLLLTLWNLTFQRNNPKYLAWYAEVIVESSFCDDREACWDSMQPLVNSIESRYLQEDSTTEANIEIEKENDFPNQVLLPCLGYILSRRKMLFRTVQDSINNEYNSLIQKLSRSCNDIKFWVSEKSIDGGKSLVNLLVELGIVSKAALAGPDKGSSEDTAEQEPSSHSFPRWCDPNPMELRRALERIQWSPEPSSLLAQRGSYGIERKILSNPNQDRRLIPASKLISPSIELFRYLGDDLLRQVFSFLGYKKMVKLRVVCKCWRELADENRFWQPMYGARFGMLHDGSALKEMMWKDRFIEKWMLQRELLFSKRPYTYNERNKTVFKHRVCRWMGCHRVITSPEQLKEHIGMHRATKALNEKFKGRRSAMEQHSSQFIINLNQQQNQNFAPTSSPSTASPIMDSPATLSRPMSPRTATPTTPNPTTSSPTTARPTWPTGSEWTRPTNRGDSGPDEANDADKSSTASPITASSATLSMPTGSERTRPTTRGDSGLDEMNDADKKQPASVEADNEKSEAQKLYEAEKEYPCEKLIAMAYGLAGPLSYDIPKHYDPPYDLLKQEVHRRDEQYFKKAGEDGNNTSYKPAPVSVIQGIYVQDTGTRQDLKSWLLANPNLNEHDNSFLLAEIGKLARSTGWKIVEPYTPYGNVVAKRKRAAVKRRSKLLSKGWNGPEPEPEPYPEPCPDVVLSECAAVPYPDSNINVHVPSDDADVFGTL